MSYGKHSDRYFTHLCKETKQIFLQKKNILTDTDNREMASKVVKNIAGGNWVNEINCIAANRN